MTGSSRPPLRWVSPGDPRTSEIARYSIEILPHLAEIAWLEADPGSLVKDGIGDFSEGAPPTGIAPLPVYHIGNNPAHLPIFEQSLLEPGLVVLHDLSLLDLAREISRDRGDPHWWKRETIRQYGDSVSNLVHRSENSAHDYAELTATYPLFLPFVESALGVVAHSAHAKAALLERLPTGALVEHLDLPGTRPDQLPERDYSDRPLQVVFCGHAGPNRRLAQFFEAWGKLDDVNAFRLQLYGNIPNQGQLLRYAEHYGVSELVDIHGYVSSAELESALQSAHLAINLRWPTMGEASASQLRYWSAGLPSLVTDVGWYSELPDEVVCKVGRSTEVEDIVDVLQDASTSPRRYQEIGERGWQYLGERHQHGKYARQLARFAEQLIGRRLGYKSVERDLVGLIAGMCEDRLDVKLFSPAVEVAAQMLGPELENLEENMK